MTALCSIWTWITKNPIVITQAIAAVLTLSASFGLKLSPTTAAEITTLGQMVAAFIARAFVTPNPTVGTLIQTALSMTAPANMPVPSVQAQAAVITAAAKAPLPDGTLRLTPAMVVPPSPPAIAPQRTMAPIADPAAPATTTLGGLPA